MKFVNLTDHEINIISKENVEQDPIKKTFFISNKNDIKVIKTIEPSKNLPLPRVEVGEIQITEINNIPVETITENKIINLPPPKKETLYIVSRWVVDEGIKQGRKDLVGISKIVRDKNNPKVILGCLALRKV